MGKVFNVTGTCRPELHYMVDITERLEQIKKMVDAGQYFTINRARQYGKTTTLKALGLFLKDEYQVIQMDFQRLAYTDFESEHNFVAAFADELLEGDGIQFSQEIADKLASFANDGSGNLRMRKLFRVLSRWCHSSERKIVLIIDEIDSATDNQVFLDFLAQLRSYYLDRDKVSTFQSVILASVYDVKNIKRKIRQEEDHRINSPWNISADFDVAMDLSRDGIRGMLCEYEKDHHTGMDTDEIAGLLYDYTSGYPYLVSRLCKLMDEKVAGSSAFPDKEAAWTEQGFLEAARILLSENNTLFESLMGKLLDSPELCRRLNSLLFAGEAVAYHVLDPSMNDAIMFGFVKKQDGNIIVANRIYEILLYNYFLTSAEAQDTLIYRAASNHKTQFIREGRLDMVLVLKKFVEHFDSIYGEQREAFDEEEGRRRFLLYLRPIINGAGNYYVEPETRNARRMDVVVDYFGERFIIELKIWRGNAYHERGERQLSDYLDYFDLKKGYMLSYNFNKKKEIGVKEIHIGNRLLIEAVV